VDRPSTVAEAAAAVRAAGPRGVLPRGLGRSYGDAAQNSGGRVLDMTALAHLGEPDRTGVVEVDGGVSLDQLIRMLLPVGRFVPVTPGTRQVTVGGAVAADVHGKNHHRAGSFSAHVRSLDLLGADGQVRTVSPEQDPLRFAATAGGMGLTGVIVGVRLRTVELETSRMTVDTVRAGDLDGVMTTLEAVDRRWPYSVAWVDLLARGRHTGRGIVTAGDHTPLAVLPPVARRRPLTPPPPPRLAAPPWCPPRLLNRASVAAFNEAWFRRAPRRRDGQLQHLAQFFHPLDGIRDWNRLYGPAGFLQYQVLVPFGAEATLHRLVQSLAAARAPGFLGVLKRFGPAGLGLLSFPCPGWTLAVDLPTRVPGLPDLLDALDELVAGAGGRTYLAKDSRVRPAVLAAMYPRLADFQTVRRQLDPHGVFASDLSRRLGL
jgi:decaprenylphospho-beta-D-ribofuranose 2-oxidase